MQVQYTDSFNIRLMSTDKGLYVKSINDEVLLL